MAYDIFISYRRTDNKGYTTGTSIARSIKQQLELERYKDRIFFDYSNLHDEEFEKIILSAIEQSRIFILVLTQDAMMRCVNPNDWVRREIMHAQKCGLKIIPINPDNLFNGYPNEFPKELEIVRKIQHTTIHMDASFESDIRLLIEKRIEPALQNSNTPSKTSTTAGALVRIEADLDCHILRFGKEIATARADELEELRLPKGKHKLSFISLDEKSIHEDIMLTINDIEFEEYIEINLRERYDALKAEQEQLRKAEEAALKKAQEEKARQEAEKRRQAAEEARKKAEEKKRIEEEAERKRRETKEQRAKQIAEHKKRRTEIAEKQELDRLFKKGEEWYNKGDYYTASLWFQKAADKGHPKAYGWVLLCNENYKDQTIVKPKVETPQSKTNYAQSRNTTNQQQTTKQTELVELFTKGLVEYNKGDFLSAVQWFRKAAEQGHAGSQYWLGYCYENGKGVGKNSNAAVLWYRNAAEQGNTNARYKLTKYDDVSRREREKETHTIAEQQQQQTLAEMFTKGIVCYENKDYPTAVDWFRKAAQQGYVQAQNWLGYCYYNGHGVTKDYNIAVGWFNKAAQQGYYQSQYWLGYCYYNGHGVTKDYNVAVGWFRKSAQQGYAEAQFCLGLCYAQGDGVKQNERRAGEWFTKAAQQGLAEAQYMLGLYFECGTGVEKDIEEAKKWYQKAADQGNEDAKKALSKIGKGFFGRLFG